MAVARELKKQVPDCRIVCVSERGGKFQHLITQEAAFDSCYFISAGKFRRYHGESFVKKITDIKTLLLNVRDFFRFLRGTIQAKKVIRKTRPDVVFIKGGFVSVPVGFAAARRKIPIITHDSDTIPGLANRLVAKWATKHATGMPANLYAYPQSKTVYTGVPIGSDFRHITPERKVEARSSLGIPKDAEMIFFTGGSQGALQLNEAVEKQYEDILGLSKNLFIFHQVGKDNLLSSIPKRVKQFEYIENIQTFMAAADIVVCRASATTITELSIQGKPVVLVPAAFLAGGHQVKNADYLLKQNAVLLADETVPDSIYRAIEKLLAEPNLQKTLAENLHKTIKTDATREIVALLLATLEAGNATPEK